MNALAYLPSHNLIAFAAGNTICIMRPGHYDPEDISSFKVLYTLEGHTDRVNGVMWVEGANPPLLLSISADMTVIFRSFTGDGTSHAQWGTPKIFKEVHKDTVNYLSTLAASEQEYYGATMCAGGIIALWAGNSCDAME